MVADAKQDQGVGQLLTTLGHETGALVRQELHLASVELAAKGTRAAQAAGIAVAGGAVLHAGLLCVLAGLVLALGLIIPAWLGAFLVGALVSVAGYALLQSGLSALKRVDPLPREAVNALQADSPWPSKETSR